VRAATLNDPETKIDLKTTKTDSSQQAHAKGRWCVLPGLKIHERTFSTSNLQVDPIELTN
jgi:hypothetical protein